MFCIYQNIFSILYPKYRESYLIKKWNDIRKIMKKYNLNIEIHKNSRTLIIKNSIYTKDIYLLIKGRDFLRLVVRSVSLSIAKKIFNEGISCCIINMDFFFKKNIKHEKNLICKWKREYLIFKVLEFITKCYIIKRGDSISIIGPYKNIKNLLGMINNKNKKTNHLKLLQFLSKSCIYTK
uniref:KRR-R motif-containing protein 1 n=1 Tax=Lotharella vacuolata TaxID=74820 RepID=A0A0H5BH06_9EUKA|nr:rRNA processing protein Mis3 [Lotharella vacuolata]